MNKPTNFNDLLELQRILDENIEKNRKNGFVPRKRNVLDILLAIDDEFQEWLRELPKEYNFKTWKQKEYSREKELEELTDVLFFFLQYFNRYFIDVDNYKNNFCRDFFERNYYDEIDQELYSVIMDFKYDLWNRNDLTTFYDYMKIVYKRGFTRQDLLETYWEKWQKNITRINKDWILEGK